MAFQVFDTSIERLDDPCGTGGPLVLARSLVGSPSALRQARACFGRGAFQFRVLGDLGGSRLSREEGEELEKSLAKAVEAVNDALSRGLEPAMNRFNQDICKTIEELNFFKQISTKFSTYFLTNFLKNFLAINPSFAIQNLN